MKLKLFRLLSILVAFAMVIMMVTPALADDGDSTSPPPPEETTTTEVVTPPEITTTEAPPEVTTTTEAPPEIVTTTEAPPEVTTTTEAPPEEVTTTEAPPIEYHPNVTTDKDDYTPGETVKITVTGFWPNEPIHFDAMGSPNGLHFAGDGFTDDKGGCYAEMQMPPGQDDVYILVVTGVSSGLTAQTTFTDGDLSPNSLPNGTQGSAYSVILNASPSNKAPYAWSISSGSLPPGLSLGSLSTYTNTISGTPTTSGTYSFNIQIIPSGSATISRSYTITIESVGTGPSGISDPTSVTIIYGSNASFSASATGTPAPTIQWQLNTGSGWNDIVGATNTTLTITTPPVSYSGNQYRAVFTNTFGSVTTGAATLTVNKANATIVVTGYNVAYDGNPHTATGTATGVGGASLSGLDLSGTIHTNMGDYTADTWTFTDSTGNYNNSSGTVHDIITKATATITLGNLNPTYDGTAKTVSATTVPTGLTVVITYSQGGSPVIAPTDAGSYAVSATIDNPNYQGSASGTMIIGKAAAIINLGDLSQTYDGTPKQATATTDPSGLTVIIAYSQGGSPVTEPTNAGSYGVSAIIDDANYQGSTTGTLVIGKATATVTLGDLNQTYDGSPKSASATTSPSGLTVDFTYDGSSTQPINAGSYAVVGTINNTNYQGTKNGTLIIAKADATITLVAVDLNQTYDGTTKVVNATTNPSGLSYTVTYKQSGSDVSPVNAGDYDVTATIDDINYQGSTDGTLTIEPRDLTVSATGIDKVYDSDIDAEVTLSTDAIEGDEVTVGYTDAAFADEHVGTGIAVHVTGISITGGSDAGNYNLVNDTADTTADIIAKDLTVSAMGIDKVYDSDIDAEVTLSTDAIEGDEVTVGYTDAAFADEHVGTGIAVHVTGISIIGGSDADNYNLVNDTADTIADITALAITGHITAENKEYDSTVTATIATRTLTGAIDGDDVSYSGGTATFASEHIGTGILVTATGLSLTGSDAGNYTVNSTATTTADITAKDLTVSAMGIDKVYDSDIDAEVTLSTDAIEGDEVTVGYTDAAFADEHVDTGIAVHVTGISITGGSDADNYNLVNDTADTTANITPKDLTVSATCTGKTYDGNTGAVVTLSTDKISGDEVTASYIDAQYDSKEVGSRTVTVSGISISGDDTGNYNLLNDTVTTTANITPLHITGSFTVKDKVYDGNNSAEVLTRTLNDVIDDDDVNLVGGTATFSDRNAGNNKEVTLTGATLDGEDAGNYMLDSVATTTADITPAPLTITAQTNTKTYDGNISAAAVPVPTGMQGDDTVTDLSEVYDNKNAGSGKTLSVDTYTINDGNGGNNYSVTTVNDTTGVINQRSITVTAVTDTKTYDGNTNSDETPEITSGTLADGDTAAWTQTFDTKNADTGKTLAPAGTVKDTGEVDMTANYDITFISVDTGEIIPAALTVTANDQTKTYGDTFTFTGSEFTHTAMVGDEDIASVTLVSDGAAFDAVVGTYDIVPSDAVAGAETDLDNYDIEYVNGTLTVEQATTNTVLTISAGKVHFMDYVTFSADIKPANTVSALTGSVEFFIGSRSYGIVDVVPIPDATDGSVQATIIVQALKGWPTTPSLPDTFTVKAVFTSTNDNYEGSSAEKGLVIDPRDASPYSATDGFYTGSNWAWTTGPNSNTATLTLTTTLKDTGTPAGDLRAARVTFYFVNNGVLTPIPSAQNLPVGLVNVTDGTVGTASAIVQLSTGNDFAKSYTIAVGVSGGYKNNPGTLGDGYWEVVTVSKPVTGGQMVGGGTLLNNSSSGLLKAPNDSGTLWNFNITYTKSGTNPKGKVEFTFTSYYKPDGTLDSKLHTYSVQSNAIASLVISGGKATFSSKANILDITNPSAPITVDSGTVLQITMTDGSPDTLGITLQRKAGGIWYSSCWNGTKTTELTASGNISIGLGK